MPNEADTQQEHQEDRYVSSEFSNQLKSLGFHPGCPVYETATDFDHELLQKALFESTYSKPIILPYVIDEYIGETKDEWPVPMVVESVRAVYTPRAVGVGETPTGCWEDPEWFVTGFLYKSPFDPYQENVRMNALIHRSGLALTESYLQVVRNPTTVHPDTPLRWGRGAPGQPE